MALEEYGEGNKVFLKIKHGGIVQESKTEREGYKKVEGEFDGKPYKKWIRLYKAVAGYINKVEKYDRESNGRKFRGWNIFIDADGTDCVLDIPFDSRVNSRWMKIAESIDYSKPVRFSAWHDAKTDSMAFNAQQDGVSVPQKYTRENPGNMPEPTQRASGKWDYGAQEDFLTDRIIKFVIPAVELAAANRGESKPDHTDSQPDSGLESNGSENGSIDPLENIKRTVKALAGTKAVDDASETDLMQQYFGSQDWGEIGKLPPALLKTMGEKLDDLIPF